MDHYFSVSCLTVGYDEIEARLALIKRKSRTDAKAAVAAE